LLSAIEREGLIEAVSTDGRTRSVFLSPAGAARLKVALLLWDQAQQTLRSKLGEPAWSIVNDSIERLAKTTAA
jgi:DNA-binding PadR family transcriptional regulator